MAEHNKHNHDYDDDISCLVDRALSSYVPEDSLGLSQRVLGRLQENVRSRQRQRGFQGAFAFVSLCLAVLAWVVIPDKRPPRVQWAFPAPVPSVALRAERHAGRADNETPEYRRAQVSLPTTTRRKQASLLLTSRRRPSFPKLDQFPAPTPLTKEEQALLRVLAQQATALLVSSRSEIAPIDIKPLQIEPF